ncbi:hypothetical protein OKW35_002264 [Paraburkholderia sp. MM5477-R1]
MVELDLADPTVCRRGRCRWYRKRLRNIVDNRRGRQRCLRFLLPYRRRVCMHRRQAIGTLEILTAPLEQQISVDVVLAGDQRNRRAGFASHRHESDCRSRSGSQHTGCGGTRYLSSDHRHAASSPAARIFAQSTRRGLPAKWNAGCTHKRHNQALIALAGDVHLTQVQLSMPSATVTSITPVAAKSTGPADGREAGPNDHLRIPWNARQLALWVLGSGLRKLVTES